MADRRTIEKTRIVRRRDRLVIDGERIGYALHCYDARTPAERTADQSRHALSGALIVVLPGHGSTTTIGRERAANPYLTALAGASGSPAAPGRGL